MKANETLKHNNTLGLNTNHIWKELEHSIMKIVQYLKNFTIAEDIRNIVLESENEITKLEKLNSIINILQKALDENKSEQTNLFFVEFFRMSALFYFSMEDKMKAFEIVDKYIMLLNEKMTLKGDNFVDINILAERDKLILNKSQMLFWDGSYDQCEAIIFNKLSYFENENTDDIYILEMTNFYITILTYKAWIHVIKKIWMKQKSFILAMNLLKEYKRLLIENFEEPDFKEVYKRKVKIYDQYLNFLIIKSTQTEANVLDILELMYQLLKEIIKLMNKDTFKFDYDVNSTQLIYYYFQAALCSFKSMEDDEYINIENTALLILHAFIQIYKEDIQFKAKLSTILIKRIFKIFKIIEKNGTKIKLNHQLNQFIEQIETKIRELIINFDEEGVYISKDSKQKLDLDLSELFLSVGSVKNFALENIRRFSEDRMKEAITDKENINELYLITYVHNKLLYVLAKILQDSPEVLSYFDDDCAILESLNGYLVVNEDSLVLLTQNSFFNDYKKDEKQNKIDLEKYQHFHITKTLKIKKSDVFFHFYNIHYFEMRKDANFNLHTIFVTLNTSYSLNLFRAAHTLCSFILSEIEKIKGCTEPIADNTEGYNDLYMFFLFFNIKLSIKLCDYYTALKCLNDINEKQNEYNIFLSNMLTGVCLGKVSFNDLSAVYFDKCLLFIERVFLVETTEENLNIKLNKKHDIAKISDSIIYF